MPYLICAGLTTILDQTEFLGIYYTEGGLFESFLLIPDAP